MIELQPTQPENLSSFRESQHHRSIRDAAHLTTVVPDLSQTSSRSVLGNSYQLRDRVITLLPEKIAIKLDPRRLLIRIIREMPADRRVDFTCSILELISPQIDQHFKDAFIEIVVANLGTDKEHLARDILPFITTEMHSLKNIKITQKITDIPINERIEVIKASNLLITPKMTTLEIVKIIQEASAIPANERIEVIKASNLLITPEMTLYDIVKIIRETSSIPANERIEVIKASNLLTTLKMTAYDIVQIIREVAIIPTDERDTMIKASNLLITSEMTPYDIRRITQKISYIPLNERSKIIQNISEIPLNEREEVVKVSNLLITPEMTMQEIVKIILKVASIPMDDRIDVIQASNLLISSKKRLISYHGIDEVIQEAGNIPANERTYIIEAFNQLITPEMKKATYGISEIIREIADIPAAERMAVIEYSRLFITPGLELVAYHGIPEIIREINAIPINEREEIITNSLLLITPEMKGSIYGISEIIREIADIPSDERIDIITAFNGLIHPETTAHEVAQMIWRMSILHQDERRRILLLPEDLRVEAIRGLFLRQRDRRMDVHEGDRDQRTKAAIKLLFEHQKHLTKDEVNRAKDRFIAYLETPSINSTQKLLAQRALLEPRKNNEDFGPLISDQRFSILGLRITGEELIGRLWIFISHLTEEEQTNATTSMISALIDSYSAPLVRVCNQGKTQRLIVAVLQGRLAGVNIEGDVISVSTSEAIEMFFNIEAHQKIDTLKDLMEAANQFCDDHILVNRDSFIAEIENYAEVQGIEN